MDFKKLATRTLSGLVYIGVIIGCIFWGIIPFTWMGAVFATIATIEFEKITRELRPVTMPTLLLDIAGNVCLAFAWQLYPMLIWLLIILFRMILQLYVKSPTPIADMARSLMSQVYIGIPVGVMTCMGQWFGLHLCLAVFIMIWLNDTGAFIVGSTLGRHRLFERISPKKSWEGFFGGLAFNLGAGALFAIFWKDFFGWQEPLGAWMGLGAVVTVFATWGDLVESLMKRSLNIKDSGNLIPGHGGILDRIDSLLFVMPAVFIYLSAVIIWP